MTNVEQLPQEDNSNYGSLLPIEFGKIGWAALSTLDLLSNGTEKPIVYGCNVAPFLWGIKEGSVYKSQEKRDFVAMTQSELGIDKKVVSWLDICEIAKKRGLVPGPKETGFLLSIILSKMEGVTEKRDYLVMTEETGGENRKLGFLRVMTVFDIGSLKHRIEINIWENDNEPLPEKAQLVFAKQEEVDKRGENR